MSCGTAYQGCQRVLQSTSIFQAGFDRSRSRDLSRAVRVSRRREGRISRPHCAGPAVRREVHAAGGCRRRVPVNSVGEAHAARRNGEARCSSSLPPSSSLLWVPWWSGTRTPVAAEPCAGSGSSATAPPSRCAIRRRGSRFTAPRRRCSTSLVAVPFSPDWRAGGWRCSASLQLYPSSSGSDRLAAPVDGALRHSGGSRRARLQGAGRSGDGGAQSSVMRERSPEQRSPLGDTKPL